MALQAGVQTSKVLVLLGAGLTGSIVLRSGRLSELIAQLQELLKGVNEVEISPFKYDSALLLAQIQQLSQEIKELTLSSPVTIFNGNSSSSGSYASYLMPAAALGAMGYCYMWWKGLSFSDLLFVTKHNMVNAVATVSKQLEHVSEAVASTKRNLSKRLESVDWKLEEQMETSKLITNDVNTMKSNLSEIGFDIEKIHQMVSEMEGKLQLLESKQDMSNSGLLYLCHYAGSLKDALNTKPFQEVKVKLANTSSATFQEEPVKGLQFLAETDESAVIEKSIINTKKGDIANLTEKVTVTKTKIHRSYQVGLSLAPDLMRPGM
ncbi:uncharacterized protein LOC116120269 isoform X1 [Pistacia vera]|uniref:uncharacterized protein LOC116120269 isoform X1 n=1 Tax=Pistacia vera TaxID=55513 RepID=UPI001262E7CB|nr:uncharacterized protein LOC116120269 isoform X1 [Pistacia vera]XP_031262081.1 uncharacterized protein LOC116120269 isoform X1 [Pistacia vera]